MPPKKEKDSKENSKSPNRRKRPTTSTNSARNINVASNTSTPASGLRSSPSNRSRRSSAARDYHRDRAAAAASQTGPASPSPTQRPQPSVSSPRQRLRRRPQLQHSNESSSHSQTQSRSQAHHRGNTSTRTNSTRSTRSHSNSSTHSLQTTVTTASNATNASNATSATTATNASRDLFLRYASKVRPRPSSKNPDGELIMSDWCTIESDPGVFTSLIESFGVENAQVTELWSLDDDSLKCILDDYGKVHGLVFLFKWQRESSNSTSSNGNKSEDDEHVGERKPLSPEEVPEDLFFAKQVTTNACATQAILSILLNAKSDADADANTDGNSLESEQSTLKLGEMLTALKSFTTSFPADLKGEAIGASDEIRSAHNSFARKEAFLVDDSKKRIAGDDDDVFHFIAYVPHSDGNVYELDGLQPGPISVGSYNTSNDTTISDSDGDDDNKRDFAWIATARTAIQARIEKYAASEIKFNLMALTADKRNVIQSKLATLLSSGVVEDDERIQNYNVQLVQEEDRREQWKQENERRRHNYIPFCMELIRALAMSGTLQDCTRKANEKVQAARLKQRLG